MKKKSLNNVHNIRYAQNRNKQVFIQIDIDKEIRSSGTWLNYYIESGELLKYIKLFDDPYPYNILISQNHMDSLDYFKEHFSNEDYFKIEKEIIKQSV